MALEGPLANITEADLQALLTEQVQEDQHLDYKKGLFLGEEKAKMEFRADMCSFANAGGGHLVIGMADEKGVPKELCGVENFNHEDYKMQLIQVLNARITPRIPGYEIKVVPLSNNRTAVVIRIPESFAKPHQIMVDKDNYQFWVRKSVMKTGLTVDELRSVILQSDTLNERVRAFRLERLGNFIAGNTPLPLVEGLKVVYHIIPANAFSTRKRYEFTPLTTRSQPVEGVYNFGNSSRYNLDGILFHKLGEYIRPEATAWTYAQIFRNGIIEAVDCIGIPSGVKRVNGYEYDVRIINDIEGLLSNCLRLGIDLPLYVMVSLVDASGLTISTSIRGGTQSSDFRPITTGIVQLPDVQVDDYSTPVEVTMKPVLDAFWNSAGWDRSHSYDATGVWTGEPKSQ